jgi:dolichol-phosphate mannosyltransferase
MIKFGYSLQLTVPTITQCAARPLDGQSSLDDPATRKRFVSVVVPVYNEAAHLDELLKAISASPVPKEIVVVDDGSTDGTREKLLALPATDGLTILFHEKNCGKGAAIRTALQQVRGEYLLIQDSDLEYDPQDYPALLQPLQDGKANVVYGVRRDRPERGLRFYLGARLLTHLTNLLYGANIHDEATCYKVFRTSLLRRIPLECRRFEFCPEVTAKLCRLGEKIWEIPISYHPRSREQGKKLRYSDGWAAIWTLVRLRFISRRRLRNLPDQPEASPFAVAFSRLPPR